jgi:hypothetical protein
MMTKNDVHNMVCKNEISVDSDKILSMVERYPFFEILRLNFLKKLKKNDENLFSKNIFAHFCFFSDRTFAFFFINETEKSKNSDDFYASAIVSNDYFAFVENYVEKESLSNLAVKLRQARLAKIAENENINTQNTLPENLEISEENAIKLINEKKYFDALQILQTLNLANSKKSIYFAPQIKFLETILKRKL